MTSIEGNIDAKERIANNIPYSCISMKWGLSHAIVPTLDWSKRSIVWLDYEQALHLKQLEDVSTTCANLQSGSAIVITIPVDPGEIETNTNMAEKRLSDLRARVGAKNMPNGVEGKDLAKWGLAKVSRQIIVNVIESTITDRNAPLEVAERFKFVQIFYFHYADGVKMMTVGGLLLNSSDAEKLDAQHYVDLDYYKPADDAYRIDSPILTWREIKILDSKLPLSAPDVPEPSWIPETERKKYGKIYRFFPNYSEIEN
jgi:hypothetical protein